MEIKRNLLEKIRKLMISDAERITYEYSSKEWWEYCCDTKKLVDEIDKILGNKGGRGDAVRDP